MVIFHCYVSSSEGIRKICRCFPVHSHPRSSWLWMMRSAASRRASLAEIQDHSGSMDSASGNLPRGYQWGWGAPWVKYPLVMADVAIENGHL